MRAALIVATGLGLALCVHAEAQHQGKIVTTATFGWGNRSCAYWLANNATEVTGEHWIDGYLTGANAQNGDDHLVGDGMDSEGIYGEVKQACQGHPSKPLVVATGEAYYIVWNQKR
jgi:hypothetical protein